MKTVILGILFVTASLQLSPAQGYGKAQQKPHKPVPTQGIIQVRAINHAFRPSTIRVQRGRPVQVQLINADRDPHNIVFDLPAADPRISRNVAPGKRGTVTFRAPSRAGTYRFYCPVGNHARQGMVGRLIVQ